eukprot:Gb_40708 [translate_table: standard]
MPQFLLLHGDIMLPFVFVDMVLINTDMPRRVEGRVCKSQSSKYKGNCVISEDCANTCRTEGLPTGNCDPVGPNRRCFCYKHCI